MSEQLQQPFCRAATDLVSGLREMEEFCGSETFLWKGSAVLCVARTLNSANAWEVGGLADNSTVRLYVRREEFLTADSTLVTIDSELWTADSVMPKPAAGETVTFREAGTPVPLVGLTVTYQGKVWRINSAREAGTRSHFELDLGSPDK